MLASATARGSPRATTREEITRTDTGRVRPDPGRSPELLQGVQDRLAGHVEHELEAADLGGEHEGNLTVPRLLVATERLQHRGGRGPGVAHGQADRPQQLDLPLRGGC